MIIIGGIIINKVGHDFLKAGYIILITCFFRHIASANPGK